MSTRRLLVATVERLRKSETQADILTAERNRLIVQMREEGATLREIAEAASMTHAGVSKIVTRLSPAPLGNSVDKRAAKA